MYFPLSTGGHHQHISSGKLDKMKTRNSMLECSIQVYEKTETNIFVSLFCQEWNKICDIIHNSRVVPLFPLSLVEIDRLGK